MAYSWVAGVGSYLPERRVSNDELSRTLDTSDEWIVSRTGIRFRHIAAEHEVTSDLAVHAARAALSHADMTPADIDLVIIATSTPDMVFPSTACIVQGKLGIKRGAAFDVAAVCSGFVYAMSVADQFIKSGMHRAALVIGAETYSRILDWSDRGTCVLFGDGAGAVVLTASDTPGVLASRLHSDGSLVDILKVPGQVSNGAVRGDPLLRMDGGAVFKQAVRVLEECALETLAAARRTVADVDWFVAHQANVRILTHTAKKLGLADEQVVITVDRHANTSAASIPLALDVAVSDGRVKRGDTLLLEGVGGGFTWGAVLLDW